MKRFFLFFFLVMIVSCRSSKITAPLPSSRPEYSLVYVLHGDANYLYHNQNGQALQADEHVLRTAKSVAKQANHGEVFIFHEKPERKILWLFPKKDRQFFYYRNGKLITEKKYSPHSTQKAFATESSLFQKYSQVKSSKTQKIFLYFGHEVPERNNHPYYYSRPDAPFNTQIFARGVQSFIKPNSSPFNLIVLSTCNNGTPSMVQALAPYAHYLLASPQNLHLSHIDTGQLETLLEEQKSIPEIADTLAAETYHRLASFLQTSITLSVYNTRQTAAYLSKLTSSYNNYRKKLSGTDRLNDNTDCSRLPFFDMETDTLGVQTWYKAPKFGRKINADTTYSGWGCK